MKKFACLFICSVLQAAPVGNTSAPDLIEKGMFAGCGNSVDFRSGYEGDYVADGRMNQHDEGNGRVDCYQQNTNSGTVTCNIENRMDLYGVFGGSSTSANWRFTNLDDNIVRIVADTNTNFLWAIGARTILVEWCNVSLGCGGRYSSCHYQLSKLTFDGAEASTAGALFHWRQWQVNLDFSYKIHLFTPYIGTKYSNERTELRNFSVPISASGTGSNEFQNRNPVGLYVGCGLSTGNYFMLNIEGRLIDEEAITISADFRF
jgi:hypothetical protein